MGITNIRDLLTSFSPSMDFFAITTGDGRIKIWDTLKGQVQTEFADILSTEATNLYAKPERGHLSVDYTCMKWINLDRKRKRKHLSLVLLLGTGGGDVLALDVAAGQLKWRVSDCHPGGVSAISFSIHESCVYAAGADGMICKIDPVSGNLLGKFKASTNAISYMSVSPDGKLVATAAAQLKIFSCLDQKKIQKFSGHPGSVRCIIFSEDGSYIFSSSVGERYVAVWRIDSSRKQSASCVLAMEHPAVFLDSKCVDSNLYVLAISEIGACYLWNGKNAEDLRNVKPTKVSLSLEHDFSKDQRGAQPAIYAAKLQDIANHASCHVFVAYGLLVRPSFQKLLVQFGIDVKLKCFQNGVLLPSQSHVTKKGLDSQSGVTALDRANAGDALLPIPKVFEVPASNKLLKSLGHDHNKEVPDDTGKSMSLESSDLQKTQVETRRHCMEDQLRSLGIISNKDDHISTSFKEINIEANVPPRKMRAAVSSMAPNKAFKLLTVLLATWHSRSCSRNYVLPWIYSILVTCNNYIASQEVSSEVLDCLYKSTESKRLGMQSLLQLSGRLHLVTAQIDKVSQHKSPTTVLDDQIDTNEDEDDVDDHLYGVEDENSESGSDEND